MKKKTYHLETSCVQSTAELIDAMQETGREIKLATLRRHCADLEDWERNAGYATGRNRAGLRLAKDYYVGFFKSRYDGKPCYYICHSCIEYVWTAS